MIFTVPRFHVKRTLLLTLVLYVFEFKHSLVTAQAPPPCPSEIYCTGKLLHTIQMAKIFKDSKTFVDMKLKEPSTSTTSKFGNFLQKSANPSQSEVKKFVDEQFEDVGQEFETWDPSDWKDEPSFVQGIKDMNLQRWVVHLHKVWKQLGRKIKDDVKSSNELYSLIWVPNPVVVPGGRFREFYYWDSYWIIQGLLLSDMHDTAKGMLENFLTMVDTYGMVPNGGRIYYTARSQPPLLIPSIKLYYDHTQDINFLKEKITTIEKEYQFWINNHILDITIKDKTYKVAFYGDKSSGPRPESYSEDVHTASDEKDNAKKEAIYSELKAAAESGWDFSSRWFIKDKSNKGTLADLKTRSIIPVDLNSILCWNARILSEFYGILGNAAKSVEFKKQYNTWEETVRGVHWHDDVGAWLDYDKENNLRRNYFYPSNLNPLWTECYDTSFNKYYAERVVDYMNIQGGVGAAGIPTSHEPTGEQWDSTNTWPPLQHIVIVGLNNTGIPAAQKMAKVIARNWIYANYLTFMITGHMYEKYDSTGFGVVGRGGEYEVQLGFGWTNGVVMDLLYRYAYSKAIIIHNQETLVCIFISLGINCILTLFKF